MVGHKEEVVISGIGGLFPEANNVEELKDLLFNKVNGITMDSSRWNQCMNKKSYFLSSLLPLNPLFTIQLYKLKQIFQLYRGILLDSKFEIFDHLFIALIESSFTTAY